jgi:hypothetical protein
METADPLIAGREAFASQDWAGTIEALSSTDALPPDANEALATARWWLDDPAGAIAAWEAAYAGYLREANTGRASRVAVTIAREYASALGNSVAANGWLGRAADALHDDEPCVERGWIALAEAERTRDPAAALAYAAVARDAARTFGDTELEIHALAGTSQGRGRPCALDRDLPHLRGGVGLE